MPTLFIGRWLAGSGRFFKSTLSLMATTPEAQRRAMILTFWKKYGTDATRGAFGVSRATLCAWRRRLTRAQGRLSALEPKSRRPRSVRKQTTEHRIVCRICSLRHAFPHDGKEKLKVILAQEGIAVSSSTIGRVVARNHLPGAPRLCVARRRRVKRLRLPAAFVTRGPGGLVSMDVVILQQGGERKYVVTALGHRTRLGLARAYPRLSSRKAEETLARMELALGTRIEHALTDNGAEFFGVFEQACRERSITHYRTYPRSPKMNARMERFNRTLQEEARLPLVTASVETWNAALAEYLLDYNFHRPHRALGYLRPIDACCASRSTTPEQSRMCWTHTSTRPQAELVATMSPCPLLTPRLLWSSI